MQAILVLKMCTCADHSCAGPLSVEVACRMMLEPRGTEMHNTVKNATVVGVDTPNINVTENKNDTNEETATELAMAGDVTLHQIAENKTEGSLEEVIHPQIATGTEKPDNVSIDILSTNVTEREQTTASSIVETNKTDSQTPFETNNSIEHAKLPFVNAPAAPQPSKPIHSMWEASGQPDNKPKENDEERHIQIGPRPQIRPHSGDCVVSPTYLSFVWAIYVLFYVLG